MPFGAIPYSHSPAPAVSAIGGKVVLTVPGGIACLDLDALETFMEHLRTAEAAARGAIAARGAA